MVEIRNVTVPGCEDLAPAIISAATEQKWTTTVTAPDVVRCTLNARMWSMTIDVHHAGDTFTFIYIDSEGLFFDPDRHAIHPTYNSRAETLRRRIMMYAGAAPRRTRTVATVGPTASTAQPTAAAASVKPYTIELFTREKGESVSYRFVLKLTDTARADLALSRRIQSDLRESVRADYAAFAAIKDPSSLRVDFPQYTIKDGKIEGYATVVAIELLEFVYDPETAHGRLAVRVPQGQYDSTRRWVRDNIATLAKDTQSGIFGTSIGSIGTKKFKTGKEILRDGNVLEMEFSVGE